MWSRLVVDCGRERIMQVNNSVSNNTYTPYKSNTSVKAISDFSMNDDEKLEVTEAEDNWEGFADFGDYQEFHKQWMSQGENGPISGQRAINEMNQNKSDSDVEVAKTYGNDNQDINQKIVEYINSLYERLLNDDTEQKFPIGAMSLSLKEWDELMEKFDLMEEEIRKAIEAEIEKQKEADQAEEISKTDETIDNSTMLTSEIRQSVFKEATESEPAIMYVTCFTTDGIICKRAGMNENEYLWKMDFKSEKDYEKVKELMDSFPTDWNLRFAPNERFWKDYLAGNIDKDDFVNNLNQYSDKGKMNYIIEKDGNTYINREAAKYCNYMNSPETRIYTLQEVKAMFELR